MAPSTSKTRKAGARKKTPAKANGKTSTPVREAKAPRRSRKAATDKR